MANPTSSHRRPASLSGGEVAIWSPKTTSDFFKLPFKDREDAEKELPGDLRRKIQVELDRIDSTRKRFETESRTAPLLNTVKSSHEAWRQDVNQRKQNRNKKECKAKDNEQGQGFIGRSLAAFQRITRPNTSYSEAVEPRTVPAAHASTEPSEPTPEDPFSGFRVGVMHFEAEKDGSGFKGVNHQEAELYTGEFPGQKICLQDALHDKHNPFTCETGRLKYFHFPANHMDWIEQAIARYYDEEDKPKTERIRSNHVLSRQHWRGQLHGSGPGKGPVHGRHMRPRCSSIPLDTQSGAFAQRDAPNFSMFLPYLHWETNKGRASMAQVVREVWEAGDEEKKKKTKKMEQKARRRTTMRMSERDSYQVPSVRKSFPRSRTHSWHTRGFENAADQILAQTKKSRNKSTKKTLLAHFLFNVAQLWYMIAYEADERLIRHSLRGGCDSPLHLRRTLDQSYFLTLEDTTTRDRDQVVYRATKLGNENSCPVTRVVMVDQLWLWILGDKTIITSFPRRWGRNKPDTSGVHKSLRERLQLNHNKINSVYHLALLIIDQCSRVFFDRTQPTDLRPEVMDLFAEAIGRMTDHTTHAFANFWTNVKLYNDIYRSQLMMGLDRDKTRHKYLDINPEGDFLRESQDIAEELRIMGRIFSQQLNVVKDFRKHLSLHGCGDRYKKDPPDPHGFRKLTRQIERFIHHAQPDSRNTQSENGDGPPDEADRQGDYSGENDMQIADDFIQQIENRYSEITELESAIGHTTQELKELLTLKQQQASIVEAQLALERAEESVRQGRAIMAFTVVTVLFLPLGFFATFFGMNNEDINEAHWMTLGEQIKYMFSLSAAIITISLSMAFIPWIRLVAKSMIYLPLKFIWEYCGVRLVWEWGPLGYDKVEWYSHQAAIHMTQHQQRARDERAKQLELEEEHRRKQESGRGGHDGGGGGGGPFGRGGNDDKRFFFGSRDRKRYQGRMNGTQSMA